MALRRVTSIAEKNLSDLRRAHQREDASTDPGVLRPSTPLEVYRQEGKSQGVIRHLIRRFRETPVSRHGDYLTLEAPYRQSAKLWHPSKEMRVWPGEVRSMRLRCLVLRSLVVETARQGVDVAGIAQRSVEQCLAKVQAVLERE